MIKMVEDRKKRLKVSIDKQYKEIKSMTTRIRIDAVREKTSTSSNNENENAYPDMSSFDLHLSQD